MQDKKVKILISNDDGINAPGIKHLWNATHEKYDVTIVAPHREKSGSGMATSLIRPLHIFEEPWEKNTKAWKITGTPTDSVKLALTLLLKEPPDVIISGINRGSNAGGNVLYSGTVGCAIEGALRNILSIAFSCYDLIDPNYEITEKYIPNIIDYFLQNKPENGTLINVTFPRKDLKIKGFKLAKQGKYKWKENPDHRKHPEGHSYCWLGGNFPKIENEDEQSDILLLEQGYITSVPIHVLELTDHKYFKENHKHFEKHFKNF